MEADVKRWGNSYAVRVPKSELERLGLKEGDHVEVSIRKAKRARRKRTISLEGMPTFRDPDPLASERHDEYLYGPRRRRP